MRVLLLFALSTTIIAAQAPVRPAPGQTPPRDRTVRSRAAETPESESHATALIRGRVVTDDPDRTALPKVRVELTSDARTIQWMFTDSSGFFDFAALPAGHYTLLADKTGYAPTPYGARRRSDAPLIIDLTEGGREEIEIRMSRGAVIAGHVVNDLGDAVVGAYVMVSAVRLEGTRRQLEAVSRVPGQTDDRGAYRIGGLVSGKYVLSVTTSGTPAERYADFDTAAWRGPFIGGGQTFYPSSPTSGGAVPIDLRPGEERLDVDLVLTPYRPAMLSLAVTSAPNPALKGATSPAEAIRLGIDPAVVRSVADVRVAIAAPDGIGTQGREAQSTVGMPGFPAFSQLPVMVDPGAWTLVARRGIEGAIAHVNIGSGETQAAPLAVRPASRFTGQVVFQGSTRRPPPSAVLVDVIGAEADSGLSSQLLAPGGPFAVQPDGSFSVAGILGTVEFIVHPPVGWTVSEFAAGDRNILGVPMTFEGGESVPNARIVLTDQTADIGGSVLEGDARPAAGCTVIAFSGDTISKFNRYRMEITQADRTGRFTMRGLPTGSYYVSARRDIDADNWTAPEQLERLRATAISVTLGEHEKKALALQCDGTP